MPPRAALGNKGQDLVSSSGNPGPSGYPSSLGVGVGSRPLCCVLHVTSYSWHGLSHSAHDGNLLILPYVGSSLPRLTPPLP